MPGRTASTSLATRSDLITIRRTANGIWAQARPRRACDGSDDGRQPTGARQQRSVVGSVRHAEQVAARLVELLLLRNASIGLPWRRPICLRARARLPRQTAQGGRARAKTVLL